MTDLQPLDASDPIPRGHIGGIRGPYRPGWPHVVAIVMPTLDGASVMPAIVAHCSLCNASVWKSIQSDVAFLVCTDCMDVAEPGWREAIP